MKKATVQLKEYQITDGREEPWEDNPLVLPGATISKIPRICNTGPDCYIRVRLNPTQTDPETEDWIYGIPDFFQKSDDGYYYSTGVLKTGDSIDFFQGVQIPADLSQSQYEEKTLSLGIDVDACALSDDSAAISSSSPWSRQVSACIPQTGDLQTPGFFSYMTGLSLLILSLLLFRKKKKFRIISLLFLLLFTIPFVTAYFTDRNEERNVTTVGINTIEVIEEFESPAVGKKTIKNPRAKNTGNVSCYVRSQILLTDSRAEEAITYYYEDTPGLNQTDWIQADDGWLYYRKILPAGATSSPVFTHLFLTKQLPSTATDLSVDVLFESVQSDGFSDPKEAFTSLAG